MPWKERGARLCSFSRLRGRNLEARGGNSGRGPAYRQPGGCRPGALRRETPSGRSRCRRRARAHRFRFAGTRPGRGQARPRRLLWDSIAERFSGGSLVQDIPTELGTKVCHSPEEDELPDGSETPDAMHSANLGIGRVFDLSGAPQAEVNSWHHQSVLEPGRGLRVTARAPDGVVEAVEWMDDSNWVVGVQWHPERMTGDALAQSLFRELVAAARLAQAEK